MMLVRILGISMVVLLLGCALVTAAPPKVKVAAVALRAVGLLDQVLEVSLCVTNPNQAALAFHAVAVSVNVGSSQLATGTSEAAVLLPPLSAVVVPFAVATTVHNIGSQFLAILRKGGGVEYQLSGMVSLAEPLPLDVPFSYWERLDLLTAGHDMFVDGISPPTGRVISARA